MNETKAARSPGRVNLVPDHMTKQSYAVVIVCFLCWMFSTIGNGVYSVASPMLQEMFGMSTATSGLVVSAFSLGGWVSTLVLPKIADKYGRRLCLGICVIIIVVCNGTYGLIGSIGMLFVVRFFCNWGNTCIWAVNASYISEMVPAKQRAFYTGIMQSGTPIGNFLSSFLISILVGIGLSWQSVSYTFFFALLLLIPIFFVLKESPTWLQNKLEFAQAKAAKEQAAQEAAGITTKKQGYTELFKKKYRKNVILGCLMSMFGGILTWGNSAYFVLSLADMGYPEEVRTTMHMCLWGVAIIGYAASGGISDKIGRKRTMLIFRSMMVIALGVILVMFYTDNLITPLVYVCLAFAGLGMGGMTIQITYTNEMMPPHVRTIGTGFAIGCSRLTAMIAVPILGAFADVTSVPLAWFLSAAIGWLMVPVAYMCMETAGKNLDEISD